MNANSNQPPPPILMAINDVCATTGYCKSFIFEQARAGNFPKPIKLGRSSRWITAEVHKWVADKALNREEIGV
jgi:prophage regulatory protein